LKKDFHLFFLKALYIKLDMPFTEDGVTRLKKGEREIFISIIIDNILMSN